MRKKQKLIFRHLNSNIRFGLFLVRRKNETEKNKSKVNGKAMNQWSIGTFDRQLCMKNVINRVAKLYGSVFQSVICSFSSLRVVSLICTQKLTLFIPNETSERRKNWIIVNKQKRAHLHCVSATNNDCDKNVQNLPSVCFRIHVNRTSPAHVRATSLSVEQREKRASNFAGVKSERRRTQNTFSVSSHFSFYFFLLFCSWNTERTCVCFVGQWIVCTSQIILFCFKNRLLVLVSIISSFRRFLFCRRTKFAPTNDRPLDCSACKWKTKLKIRQDARACMRNSVIPDAWDANAIDECERPEENRCRNYTFHGRFCWMKIELSETIRRHSMTHTRWNAWNICPWTQSEMKSREEIKRSETKKFYFSFYWLNISKSETDFFIRKKNVVIVTS